MKVLDIAALLCCIAVTVVGAPALTDRPGPYDHMLLKRDNTSTSTQLGSYSTSIASVSTSSPTVSPSKLADQMAGNLMKNYWNEVSRNFVDQCGTTNIPVVWNVAVASYSINYLKNDTFNEDAYSALYLYRNNNTGGFSASTADNNDIYTDDDSQVSWAFLNFYLNDDDDEYLDSAEELITYITEQKAAGGGINWDISGNYVASISTLEAAYSALWLYTENNNDTLVSFAKEELNWTFSELLDPTDHLIYDGKPRNGNVNQGELTYTVGVAISALALLTEIGDKDQDWQAMATELGVRAFGAGNLNSTFYTNGYLHDGVQYTHNLFEGIVALLEKTKPSNSYQQSAYDMFKAELVREARNYYDSNQSDLTTSKCGQNINSLLDYASYVQIFGSLGRIVDGI